MSNARSSGPIVYIRMIRLKNEIFQLNLNAIASNESDVNVYGKHRN